MDRRGTGASGVVAARPTRVRLRPWQSEALDRFAHHPRPDFLAVATPGAGKTTFALAAAVQYLTDHPGRRVVVVAPTQHLKHQWATAAARFRLHLDDDWSARQPELPGDVHGIVTTYQQVATSSAELARVASSGFVVLDEVHHAGDDRTWGSSVVAAFGGAARRLSLSGTPFRSDASAIPFVDYHLDEARPDFEYGYGEALGDGGVVRPVFFPRINGFMEWVAPDGQVVTATFDDDLERERANQRLRTALSLEGEWLPAVLRQADERLAQLRRDDPTAGGLVVAIDQAHAQGIGEVLRRRGVRAVVATSDEADATERIRRFGASEDEWIVAVRMVSEGVDLPRLRIAVFATTTTTELFFRQAVGRVVRHTTGLRDQRAYVFLPDDPRLRRHAAAVAELRRHNLSRRQVADRAAGLAEGVGPADEDGQMSLFAVVGAVAGDVVGDHLDGLGGGLGDGFGGGPGGARGGSGETSENSGEDADDAAARWSPGAAGVFGPPGDALEPPEPAGVELVLEPPPLPGGGIASGTGNGLASAGTGPGGIGTGGIGDDGVVDLRRRRSLLRELNADVATDLVRTTGWSHPAVNAELNRLASIRQVSGATVEQLERRLECGRRWLRQS